MLMALPGTFYHVIHGHEWTDLATPPGVGDHWRNPENFRSAFITEYMLKNTMNGFRGMKEKNPVVDNIGDLHWGSDGAIFFRSMVDAVLMCTLAKPGEGPVQILQVTVPGRGHEKPPRTVFWELPSVPVKSLLVQCACSTGIHRPLVGRADVASPLLARVPE